MQQANIHTNAPAPASMTQVPNSLSLSTNAFLVDRTARQSTAAPGLYDTLQALSNRNDASLSRTAGLGHLMPGLNNGDMGLAAARQFS